MYTLKKLIASILFVAIILNFGNDCCCFCSLSTPISNNLIQDHHHETSNSHKHEGDGEVVQSDNKHKDCCVEVKVNDDIGYIAESVKPSKYEPVKISYVLVTYIGSLKIFVFDGFHSELFPPKPNYDNLYLIRSASSCQFTGYIRLLI